MLQTQLNHCCAQDDRQPYQFNAQFPHPGNIFRSAQSIRQQAGNPDAVRFMRASPTPRLPSTRTWRGIRPNLLVLGIPRDQHTSNPAEFAWQLGKRHCQTNQAGPEEPAIKAYQAAS